MSAITAWSYSRYRDYKKCPFLAKCKHVDKMKEPGSPAMERGSFIHKVAEDFVRGAITGKMPEELRLLKDHFLAVRARRTAQVEEQWCYDREWNLLPASAKDFSAYTAQDWQVFRKIWLRVKTDLHDIERESNTLMIVDHKTGKFREYELSSYEEQLEISAMAGLLKYPDVKAAAPMMWYLDEGLVHPGNIYKRADLPRLIKVWEQKTKPMFTDTAFRPKPNDKCKWCFFRKANNGPCTY